MRGWRGWVVLAIGAISIGAAPPSAGDETTARYEVVILPGSRALYIRAHVPGLDWASVNGWIAGSGELGAATRLPATDGIAFAYTVAIPERAQSNAPESELDGDRLRAWGSSIFLIPNLVEGEVGPFRVCFDAPSAWTIATPAGAGRCLDARNVDDLLAIPMLAGDVAVDEFEAAGSRILLALRRGHPVSAPAFRRSLTLLVEGATAYLGAPPPPLVFVGVDRLGSRATYAPGNNVTNTGRSATLLIDDDRGPSNPKFWGTYAHEYTHSWVPGAFGGIRTTREELGSVFTEGFTDYLAYRIGHAAGLYDRDQFLGALSEFYLEYREAATRDPPGNPEFLRYRQGMMAAWMLDVELLKASRGRVGFRELMRLLLARHAATDGLTRAEMRAALRVLGGARVARRYDELTDIARPIDPARHLAGTGIAIRVVDDVSAALDRGDRVVTADPGAPRERRFVARWLAG